MSSSCPPASAAPPPLSSSRSKAASIGCSTSSEEMSGPASAKSSHLHGCPSSGGIGFKTRLLGDSCLDSAFGGRGPHLSHSARDPGAHRENRVAGVEHAS